MVQVTSHTKYYWTKFDDKVGKFNKHGRLPAYFADMIGDKKKVSIAELGAGLVNTIGDEWPGVDVSIACSDSNADSFNSMWKEKGKMPIHPIDFQDMEDLAYPENYFDIVHCRNALDHTPDPLKAIEEMKRVSSGWVYLAHALNQMSTYGGHHEWDVRFEDGKCYFYGKEYSFVLGDEWDVSFDGELVNCKYEI